ncbi:Abi family protein [Weissella cibaria]|uniref:Abi family protein n=1 Tax=Weissella cibaria TaxID=137591 RepID=UPI0013D9B226|nr:Abi family protein [Weissella cibaria]NFA02030.1 Abi family protein [Weissella cibaria]
MDFKHSSTVIEQITKLTDRGLTFDDITASQHILNYVGYYPIINAYKAPFIKTGEQFIPGTTFEDIYNLYEFDRHERRIVQSTLESIELTLRQISSRAFIEAYGDDPAAYLAVENYRNIQIQRVRRKFFNKVKFPIDIQGYADPFKHYLEEYGSVPLWVLMTGWDFGTLIHFINFQKPSVKLKIAREFFRPGFLPNDEQLVYFMGETLQLLLKFRNRVAHGNRVYNYRPKTKDSTGDLRPSLSYLAEFHGRYSIDEATYAAGFGQGDIYTLILITNELMFKDSNNIIRNQTLDNIIAHLHGRIDLDNYIFKSIGFPTLETVSFVNMIINRNKLLQAQKKISNIYDYVPVTATTSPIIDFEISQTQTGLFNMHPY